jgi:hypothetical protein
VVDLHALHAVTIELHGGMLTLAAVCLGIKVMDILWGRFLGDKGGILRRTLKKASEYSGPTILLAAFGGVVGLILSGITGSSLIPVETATNSPIALNKVMVSIFATEFWSILIAMNLAFQEKVWDDRRTATMMVVFGGLGYFFSITGGSIGGTMAGKESIMEPMWHFLGVDLHSSWILSSNLVFVLIGVVNVVGILLVLFTDRLSDILTSRHETPNK